MDEPTVGFPAHAGIDRPLSTSTGRSTRFPRPRGDRPETLLDAFYALGFPRPRGDRPVYCDKYRVRGWVSPPTRG